MTTTSSIFSNFPELTPGALPGASLRSSDLVINLKTAKQLGLTIPPEVLFQADKLIR